MTRYAKAISVFDHLESRGEEASDEHYTGVHYPWARRMLRADPAVVSYTTAKALRRHDITGRFGQAPARWRYVMLRLEPHRRTGFGPDVEETIAQDHRNFLQNWRSFAVEEDVILDRRTGQNTFVAYLFEFGEGVVPDLRAALLEAAPAAYGLRAITLDTVLTEAVGAPIDAPGQRPVREPLPRSEKAAFAEFLFDQEEWAEEWFRGPAAAVLRGALGHRVELSCGFDDR